MSVTGFRPRTGGPDRTRSGLLVPPPLRSRLRWLAVGTALWVVGWAIPVWHRSVAPAPFNHLDRRLGDTAPSIHQVAGWFADLGDAPQLVAILAVVAGICVLGRSRRALLAVASSLVVVLVTVEVILKPVVGARLVPHMGPSFPSGHTATACCLATLAVLLLGRRQGPLRWAVPRPVRVLVVALAIVIGPVVGLSMVVIGAHSVVDVLGALPLGVTLTLVTCAGVDRLGGRHRTAG